MPKYVAKMTHEQRRARRKEIAEYSKSHTNYQTAKHFGITTTTVRQSRMEHDLPIKVDGDGIVPVSSYRILAEIIRGRPDIDIAKKYDVSKQFVNQVRLRAGDAGVYDAINKKIKAVRNRLSIADAD